MGQGVMEPMGSKGKPKGNIQWQVSEPMEPMLPYPMEPNDPMCPYPIDYPVSNRPGAIQLARHYPIGQHGVNHAQGISLNRSKNAHKHLVATR